MNGFLRRLLNYDTADEQETIKRLRNELALKDLKHIREVRDLVEQFWIVQESGKDVRETLLEGLTDLRDHVARLEEHSAAR